MVRLLLVETSGIRLQGRKILRNLNNQASLIEEARFKSPDPRIPSCQTWTMAASESAAFLHDLKPRVASRASHRSRVTTRWVAFPSMCERARAP